jgi:hypothetical protein
VTVCARNLEVGGQLLELRVGEKDAEILAD